MEAFKSISLEAGYNPPPCCMIFISTLPLGVVLMISYNEEVGYNLYIYVHSISIMYTCIHTCTLFLAKKLIGCNGVWRVHVRESERVSIIIKW